MSRKTPLFAGVFALLPALASAQMLVDDPYARASSNMAVSGAAFMSIMNPTDTDDRLIAVSSDIAERVELHTHLQDAQGVMRMIEVEDGFEIPAGGMAMLQRGGMHVMFLGLRGPLEHGDEIELTLTFEHAAPITITVPVDLERMPTHGGHGNHGNHGGHGSDS